MRTNCTAFAKFVTNKKLNTKRLLVTFDISNTDKNGNIVITVRNAAYASGDLVDAADALRCVAQAKDALRINALTFV